ncbi:hypothetical protein KEM52_000005 [Ascosphaera acerosa]|nr:hypothetical protein KEM52_000005 [Ascosphaera acerosa]
MARPSAQVVLFNRRKYRAFADLILHCDGVDFPVHKLVLSRRSEVLRLALDNSNANVPCHDVAIRPPAQSVAHATPIDRVVLKGFDSTTADHLLDYLYTNDYTLESNDDGRLQEPAAAGEPSAAQCKSGADSARTAAVTISILQLDRRAGRATVADDVVQVTTCENPLLAHLRIATAADALGLYHLRALAKQKLRDTLDWHWRIEHFPAFVATIWDAYHDDPDLQRLTIEATADHRDELAQRDDWQRLALPKAMTDEVCSAMMFRNARRFWLRSKVCTSEEHTSQQQREHNYATVGHMEESRYQDIATAFRHVQPTDRTKSDKMLLFFAASALGLLGASGPCKFGKRPDEKAFAPITHKMQGAKFQVVGQSGVPAMHAALMPNNKVVFLDKIEDYTQLTLESGYYAYSSEYDLETNNAVPLAYKTNSFCAGGSFLANGTLMSVGGNADLPWIDPTVGDGFKGVRFLERELDGDALDAQPWREPGQQLDSARWYPTLQTLPNGHIMVVAGSLTGLDPSQPKNNNPTYEMINADGLPYGTSIPMAILVDSQPYYMYPFIHVLKDGNLFIFAARSSELFDVRSGTTVKKFPDLVGDYRIYPNTGSSAVLPLRAENDWSPEVIVCGGGSYVDITSPTENTCGRIRPLDETPDWEVELMPQGRTMVDAQLLPDGTVLWINGCNKGAQGFGIAKDPIFDAWIYDPSRPPRQRWYEAGASEIPRLYHSVALLLLDGTVLITGSNPVEMPVLTPNPSIPALAYVTEFRVEIYTPPYLAGRKGKERPTDLEVSTKQLRPDGMTFKINFVTHGQIRNELKVALYHGGFVTHSLHMSSRMLFLEHHGFEGGSLGKHEVFVKMPTSGNVVPPGPYHLYAVVDGVPSVGQFVMVDMEEKYKHTASRPPEGDEGKPDSGGGAAPEKGKHDTKKGSKKNAKKRKGNRKTTSGNANLSQATPDLEAQRAPVTPHWEFAKAHEMVVAHLVNNDNKSNVTVP